MSTNWLGPSVAYRSGSEWTIGLGAAVETSRGVPRSSSREPAPTQNIATRSAVTSSWPISTAASTPPAAARRNGPASPTRSAPSATALATSTPSRTPPLANSRASGATRRACRSASAVGTPQPANAAAMRWRQGSPSRCRSTSLQAVPPAPATSTAATPASSSARTTSGARPQPTSLATTGRSRRSASSPMRPSRPRNDVSPSSCTASCSGFRCSTSASASSVSRRRRQSSVPMPRLSWIAPRFASSSPFGTRGRTLNDGRTSGCSSRTRPDPRPMGSPSALAASASVALIRPASGVPPVMHEIRTGAASSRPNTVVEVRTSSRSSSGSARCRKRTSSNPESRPERTSSSRLIRMCSALRLTVRCPLAPFRPARPPPFRSRGMGSESSASASVKTGSAGPFGDVGCDIGKLLDLCGLEPAPLHLRPRPRGILRRRPGGQVRPAQLVQEAADLRLLGRALRLVQPPQLVALARRGSRVGGDDRVRELAPGEVVLAGLAGLLGLAPDAEPVVAELERDPEQPAGMTGAPRGLRRGLGHHRPHLEAGAQQRARLRLDHPQVRLGRRVGPALEPEILALAVDDLQQRVGEDLRRARPPLERRPLARARARAAGEERPERERRDPVAGVDRLRLAPDRPDRGPAAPRLVAILDVVVDEREVVRELQGAGRGQGVLDVASEGGRGPETQVRAHVLSAGLGGRAVDVRPPHVIRRHAAQQPLAGKSRRS